jgi:hypothetical protein
MYVFFIPMFMNMFMNQVYAYKKLFITEYFRSSTGLSYGVVIRKNCNPGLKVIDQLKMMSSENDSFTGVVKFQKKFDEESLCLGIEA